MSEEQIRIENLIYSMIPALQYSKDIYGVSYALKDNILFLKNQSDTFWVDLRDKFRFKEYTFYHRSNNGHYHVQKKTADFGYGIFYCATHLLSKEEHIDNRKTLQIDYLKFKKDIFRYETMLRSRYFNEGDLFE